MKIFTVSYLQSPLFFQSFHYIICEISCVNFYRLIVIEAKIHIVERSVIVWDDNSLPSTLIILIL